MSYLSSLRYATFQLPATDVRELEMWAHQITPKERPQGLPARLEVHCGDEKEFDLKLSGGAGGAAARWHGTSVDDYPARVQQIAYAAPT